MFERILSVGRSDIRFFLLLSIDHEYMEHDANMSLRHIHLLRNYWSWLKLLPVNYAFRFSSPVTAPRDKGKVTVL